jgi:hypothetical protein
VHTRRDGAGVVADQDAGVDELMQMANQHPFGDVRDAAA